MPLVNMKIKKEKKSATPEMVEPMDAPRYPWGLQLNLDEESISKLGIKEMPAVGDKQMVVAYVDVVETREQDSVDGKKRRNIELQITDMSLESRVKPDKLKTLYGDESKK